MGLGDLAIGAEVGVSGLLGAAVSIHKLALALVQTSKGLGRNRSLIRTAPRGFQVSRQIVW